MRAQEGVAARSVTVCHSNDTHLLHRVRIVRRIIYVVVPRGHRAVACRSVAVAATRQLLDQQEHDQRHESCGLRCARTHTTKARSVCGNSRLCLCVRPGHLLHSGCCGLAALPVFCPHTTHLPESRRGPKGRPPSCGYHPWPASLALVWHRLFRLRVFWLQTDVRVDSHSDLLGQHSSSAVGAQQPCLIGTGTCGSSDVLTTPVSALVSARISSVLPQRHPNPRHDGCWCGVLSASIGGLVASSPVHRRLFLTACVLARCAWMHMARAKQPPPAVATA